MKLLITLILGLTIQAQARETVCDKKASIEQIVVTSSTAKEMFAVANTSGSYIANRRLACLRNLNSTAANDIWISTFQVNTYVSAALDTSKSFPIPGGATGDSIFCLPLGSNIKIFVHTILGHGSKAVGYICE